MISKQQNDLQLSENKQSNSVTEDTEQQGQDQQTQSTEFEQEQAQVPEQYRISKDGLFAQNGISYHHASETKEQRINEGQAAVVEDEEKEQADVRSSRRAYHRELAQTVSKPIRMFAGLAHLNSKHYTLNIAWLVLILCLLPAAFALVWFVVIPMGNTYSSSRRDRLVWMLVVNPGTFCLLAFTLVNVFLSALDEAKPWRPFWTYAGILVAVYVVQVLCPGLVVLFHRPFEALGLVAYGITLVVVLAGLRITPYQWFHTELEHYCTTWRVFRKICIVLQVYMGILMLYIILNDQLDSRWVGFITFALAIVTFIGTL
eukprot:TRINITY_DN5896_c0_g3_i1.p1 TRINITY_DN5896_c0_g3~~TRINITY_DN5896_c0_g3_i1.p1  ORF type:complete len:316 (-),score=30.05 TRINITY_DN5896_c0_g3_i1:169-1116(-)